MSDLFPDMPEILSPAETWRRQLKTERGVMIFHDPDLNEKQWSAAIGTHSADRVTSQTEMGALEAMAIKIGYPLVNQQQMKNNTTKNVT
tara:strand:+ start:92 stop:358 length:267 start_codon:yes stop_codon:yes gene_type:complete